MIFYQISWNIMNVSLLILTQTSASNQKTFLDFWANFGGETVISMTRQANQTGQILPAILTAGLEQTPGTGAEDKMSSQLAGSYSFSCAGAAVAGWHQENAKNSR